MFPKPFDVQLTLSFGHVVPVAFGKVHLLPQSHICVEDGSTCDAAFPVLVWFSIRQIKLLVLNQAANAELEKHDRLGEVLVVVGDTVEILPLPFESLPEEMVFVLHLQRTVGVLRKEKALVNVLALEARRVWERSRGEARQVGLPKFFVEELRGMGPEAPERGL